MVFKEEEVQTTVEHKDIILHNLYYFDYPGTSYSVLMEELQEEQEIKIPEFFKNEEKEYLESLLISTLEHLHSDGYVSHNKTEVKEMEDDDLLEDHEDEYTYLFYKITTAGKDFYNAGGYDGEIIRKNEEEEKRTEFEELERRKFRFDKRKTFINIALTVVSLAISIVALYYSLQK